jgi:hypothetical protein
MNDELDKRFHENALLSIKCIVALSPRNGFKNFNNKDILEFARLYPKFLDADDLAHELDTFAKLKKMDDFKHDKNVNSNKL